MLTGRIQIISNKVNGIGQETLLVERGGGGGDQHNHPTIKHKNTRSLTSTVGINLIGYHSNNFENSSWL